MLIGIICIQELSSLYSKGKVPPISPIKKTKKKNVLVHFSAVNQNELCVKQGSRNRRSRVVTKVHSLREQPGSEVLETGYTFSQSVSKPDTHTSQICHRDSRTLKTQRLRKSEQVQHDQTRGQRLGFNRK